MNKMWKNFNFQLVQDFKIKTSLLLVLIMSLCQPTLAAETKIGLVNVIEVFRKLELNKDVEKILKPIQQKYRRQLEGDFKKLSNMKEKLEKNKTTLNAIDFARESRKITSLERELQVKRESAENEVRQRGDEETQLIINSKVINYLNRFARDNKYDLILRYESVLYSSSNANVTGDVIKYIRKRL